MDWDLALRLTGLHFGGRIVSFREILYHVVRDSIPIDSTLKSTLPWNVNRERSLIYFDSVLFNYIGEPKNPFEEFGCNNMVLQLRSYYCVLARWLKQQLPKMFHTIWTK